MGLRSNLLHKLKCFAMNSLYGKPDTSLRIGDVVQSKYLTYDLVILSFNWALNAAAVYPRFDEPSKRNIQVLPISGLTKISG